MDTTRAEEAFETLNGEGYVMIAARRGLDGADPQLVLTVDDSLASCKELVLPEESVRSIRKVLDVYEELR